MTATHVNGLAVIAAEPALSPITTGGGKPIHFHQIHKLLLEDESIVFGCVHCDFAGGSINAVRPHLNKHRAHTAAKPNRPKLRDLTLTELLKRLDDLERITAERDGWRARALKAEGQPRGLRKTLRGDG